jgi:hypothetical protein
MTRPVPQGAAGWLLGFAPCFVCARPFGFNPSKVPTWNAEPICGPCIEKVNEARRKQGEPEITVDPQAYNLEAP